MHINISPQTAIDGVCGSCQNFIYYLEKENKDLAPEAQEKFFNQHSDSIEINEVIDTIDNNKHKLKHKESKFYSIVLSPSQNELMHLKNDGSSNILGE